MRNIILDKQSSYTGIKETVGKYISWFPWAFALVYFIVMTYLTLKYHTIGGLEFETDFYADIVVNGNSEYSIYFNIWNNRFLFTGSIRPDTLDRRYFYYTSLDTLGNRIDEMELINRRYGINGFYFTDDTFVLNGNRILKFSRLLKERGLHVAWYCNGRVNLMTKELLKAMYDAGCKGIAYGIESGNQQILDSMNKKITLDEVREVVKWTKDAGINTTGYFMIGMLGETKATIRETMAFARELKLDFYGFSLITPFLGTELYDSAFEAGLIPKKKTSFGEWSLHVNANLTLDCSDADLSAFSNETFKEFSLKKRFGKYYLINPGLWKETKILFSLRNKEQVVELANKAKGVFSSYWHKV